MPRPPRVFLFPLLLLLFAAPAAAQDPEPEVNCDSICLMPPPWPPECLCGLGGGPGTIYTGGGGTIEIPEVDDEELGPVGSAEPILMAMLEGYERRIAGVQDFTEVVWMGDAPFPVVVHYEKVIVAYGGDLGSRPIMRMVPPQELAARQAEASGFPTPEALLGAFAQVAPVLSDAIGELPLDGLPPEARGVVNRVRLGLAILPHLAEGGLGQDSDGGGAAYDESIFWDPTFLRVLMRAGQVTEVDPGAGLHKVVARGETLAALGLPELDFDLQRITLWVVDMGSAHVPLVMTIEGLDGTSRVLIEREWSFEQTPAGPMWKSRRITNTMRLRGQLHQIRQELDQVLVNQGMPNTEESARLIREAMERGRGQ